MAVILGGGSARAKPALGVLRPERADARYARRVGNIKRVLGTDGAFSEQTRIVDLQAERVEVYRQPRGAQYERTLVVQRGEMVALEAFPDVTLPTADLLG